MTVSNTRLAAILVLSSATALGACSREAPEDLPPAPVTTTAQVTDPAATAAPSGPTVGTQSHFEQVVGSSTTVYFDTDRFNIDSADAAALQSQAQYLSQYPQITITVEGHTDERGTRDYNVALGERRANSAKNYLVGLGISANRISTVSYGKERPVALGSNSGAWAQNRRAASIVIN
ncbi:MAG: peptidoglycan-associated lipoprotein Pal [Erythrobacter sp.]